MKSKMLVGTLSALILALAIPLVGAAQNKAPRSWTTKDLKQAIATAKTAADHKNIALYYTNDAERLEAPAKEHVELAELYRKSPNLHEQKHPMSADTAAHCEWLAARYREMAQKDRDLAKLHEEMAKPAS
jgi:hypothetical protein